VQLLVSDEALKDGIDSQTEDVHEQLGVDVTDTNVEQDPEDRECRLGAHGFRDVRVPSIGDEVPQHSGSGHDEGQTQSVDDSANTSEDANAGGVTEDEAERVEGGLAERLTEDGDLDVGVLVQELDEALEAGDDVLEQLGDLDTDRVLLGLHLLL